MTDVPGALGTARELVVRRVADAAPVVPARSSAYRSGRAERN
ncbi:hypothetical protein [Microbispora catharanthi]|nr:hypothetical protein [Microbispora catharanthi]